MDTYLKTLWYSLFLVPIPAILGIIAIKILHKDFTYLGSFGDFFAGTTVPILTFISFLAIVVTLRMQKEQLKMQSNQLVMQNKELRNSIDEMQATRKEFELQNNTLSIQRFENTFFQMVNLHNDIVNSIVIYDGKSGRQNFFNLYQDLKRYYQSLLEQHGNTKDDADILRGAYGFFFNDYEDQLGHYFRNLYRIVKFIDEAELINYEDKKIYIGILRAQLSSPELALLLYNSLGIHGRNFLVLMYKYELLDNLNKEKLLNKEHFHYYLNEGITYSVKEEAAI